MTTVELILRTIGIARLVSIQGRRVRIPRLAFIQYMEGGKENAVYAGGTGRDGGGGR